MTHDERIDKIGTACAALSLFCEGRVSLTWFRDWWRQHWSRR